MKFQNVPGWIIFVLYTFLKNETVKITLCIFVNAFDHNTLLTEFRSTTSTNVNVFVYYLLSNISIC